MSSDAERVAAVQRFAGVIEDNVDKITTLLMYETGKPRAAARKEVVRSVENINETIAEHCRLTAEGAVNARGLLSSG